jgi:hypothetical protein
MGGREASGRPFAALVSAISLDVAASSVTISLLWICQSPEHRSKHMRQTEKHSAVLYI